MMRTVVFDIGETLIRDDREWGAWADWLGIPRHTLSALVGAVVAQGHDNAEALRLIRPDIDIAAERAAMEAAGVGEHLEESDLYPDVRPALAALREAGLRVLVAGNQTARAGALLRDLKLPVDEIATSGEWGIAKPDPRFCPRPGPCGNGAQRNRVRGRSPRERHPAGEGRGPARRASAPRTMGPSVVRHG